MIHSLRSEGLGRHLFVNPALSSGFVWRPCVSISDGRKRKIPSNHNKVELKRDFVFMVQFIDCWTTARKWKRYFFFFFTFSNGTVRSRSFGEVSASGRGSARDGRRGRVPAPLPEREHSSRERAEEGPRKRPARSAGTSETARRETGGNNVKIG